MDHEHYQWLADVSKSIVDSYEREQETARQPGNIQRTGTVSSRGGTRSSRIGCRRSTRSRAQDLLLETVDGPRATREHDLVVFYPHHPEALRKQDGVLASGVAAAFSIKRTIGRRAIVEAYQDAQTIRQGMKIRDETVSSPCAAGLFRPPG